MTVGERHARRIPWLLWPFWALWKLIAGLVTATGRLVAVLLGLAFLIIGVVLTATVVGAVVGIPFLLLGFLLALRGLF